MEDFEIETQNIRPDLMVIHMPPELAQALTCAQQDATAIKRADANEFAGYDYVSAEHIIAFSKPIFKKHGLSFACFGWSIIENKVKARFALTHTSGTSICYDAELTAVTNKQIKQDKAELAALTMLHSYSIRGILNLPRIETGTDINARNDEPETDLIYRDSETAGTYFKCIQGAMSRDELMQIAVEIGNTFQHDSPHLEPLRVEARKKMASFK